MIILLVVSGLGSRRKKQAQKMNKPLPSPAHPGAQETEDMAFPNPEPISGSFLPPKTRKAIARMTMSSGVPSPNMGDPREIG